MLRTTVVCSDFIHVSYHHLLHTENKLLVLSVCVLASSLFILHMTCMANHNLLHFLFITKTCANSAYEQCNPFFIYHYRALIIILGVTVRTFPILPQCHSSFPHIPRLFGTLSVVTSHHLSPLRGTSIYTARDLSSFTFIRKLRLRYRAVFRVVCASPRG